eukprot:9176227-Ditylum_brightwellii.AAC.1
MREKEKEPSSPPSKKRAKRKNKKESKKNTDGQKYYNGMSRPAYINVGSPTFKFDPVIDVADASFSQRKTSNKVSFDAGYGRKEEREPTAENLMHKYFPFFIVDEIVNA